MDIRPKNQAPLNYGAGREMSASDAVAMFWMSVLGQVVRVDMFPDQGEFTVTSALDFGVGRAEFTLAYYTNAASANPS
jgi:hypothetical protein